MIPLDTSDTSLQPASTGPAMSLKRKIYLGCMGFYAIGTIARIVLDRVWHPAGPRVANVAAGLTYAWHSRSGTFFVRPIEGYVLNSLWFLPYVTLVVGMLVWARTWREWK